MVEFRIPIPSPAEIELERRRYGGSVRKPERVVSVGERWLMMGRVG